MSVFTTEITSEEIVSDNPIHQRLLKAYHVAKPYVSGDLLELGCGEGRGVHEIAPLASSFTAIDKISSVIDNLSQAHPEHTFQQGHFPPAPFNDQSFDTIVSFQVIEHIKNDHLFLQEIHRMLRPGGTALLTTPNIKMTLTRNPWHIREYTAKELTAIASKYFDLVDMKGIAGSDKVMKYHDQNRESVKKFTRFDILDLQHKLPAALLKIPYDILNRINRNSLQKGNNSLVESISLDDYFVKEQDEQNLDLFLILKKP